MSFTEPFTIAVPAGFASFASILTPSPPPVSNMPAKYGCSFPGEELSDYWKTKLGFTNRRSLEPYWRPSVRERKGVLTARATSKLRPAIMAGTNSYLDVQALRSLKQYCDDRFMDHSLIFRDREMKLWVQPFYVRNSHVIGWALGLRAVQLTDLSVGALDDVYSETVDGFIAPEQQLLET